MSSTGTVKRRRSTQMLDVINISDDESSTRQPPVKREPLSSPPAPSTKEVELQRKVAKSEEMLKKAVVAAGEDRAARYAAESMLDSKRGILGNQNNGVANEMDKRLAELSKQLDEARRRAEESYAREMAISRENHTLKEERAKEVLIKDLLTKRVLELNGGVDDSRRMEEQNSEKEELSRENTALKEELNEEKRISNKRKEQIDKLKGELAGVKEELTAAAKQKNYLSEKNSILTEQVKISQRTGKNIEELIRENTALKKELDKVKGTSDGRKERISKLRDKVAGMKEKLEEAAKKRDALREKLVQCKSQQPELQNSSEKSIDLFQQGLAVSSKAISFDDARKKIKNKLDSSGSIDWWRIPMEGFMCTACGAKLARPGNIVDHFLSKRHGEKMKELGGAVSLSALKFWLGKIDEGKEASAAE